VNHPRVGIPLTRYNLSLFFITCAMPVELSCLRSGAQIPTPSLVNCTSHHRTTSGKLVSVANWKATELESGNNPENPPRAVTIGGFPAE